MRRQRTTWQPLVFGRFRAGQCNKGKGLWYLIGAGDAYSRGPIWDAMGNWRMMYSVGKGCNGVS